MARTRREFNYTPSYEETVERAERRTSMYDQLFKDVKFFKPKENDNRVRILPPSWENARHYGYPIWVHYDVGVADQRYLCLRENRTSPHKNCPICDQALELGPGATLEERRAISPRQAIIYYVLVRDHEQEGVQLWMASQKTDQEIVLQSINRRNKSVLNIVHPDHGYDVEFTRSGTGKNTRYLGYQVSRDASPISDNERRLEEVEEYIATKPLPSILNFYSPEHLSEILAGRLGGGGREEAPEPRVRARDSLQEKPSLREELDDEIPEPQVRRAPAPEPDDEEDSRPRRSARRNEPEEDEPEPERERPRRAPSMRVVPTEEDEDTTPRRNTTRRRPTEEPEEEEEDDSDRRSRLRNRVNRDARTE